MSVIVTAHYANDIFDVEIFHDGSVGFPGKNLQYEQAMAEFLSSKPPIVALYEYWHEVFGAPAQIIFSNIELPRKPVLLFVADCVEHVLKFYESVHENDSMVRNVIDLVRQHLSGNADIDDVKRAKEIVGKFVMNSEHNQTFYEFSSDESVAVAAEWLGWATESSDEDVDWQVYPGGASRQAEWAASHARSARARCISGNKEIDSEEWNQEYEKEAMWQIRRFVDCMEAVGQALPWPPLEATP